MRQARIIGRAAKKRAAINRRSRAARLTVQEKLIAE
jgi:hypothetical protein